MTPRASVAAPSERPSISNMMFETAYLWAQRSTCPAAQVGAVIARGPVIIATGYNGAPSGAKHCTDAGCVLQTTALRESSRHVHGEINALLSCAKRGVSTEGCHIFVTRTPCFDCVKFMASAGITNVWVPEREFAPSDLLLSFAQECDIEFGSRPYNGAQASQQSRDDRYLTPMRDMQELEEARGV